LIVYTHCDDALLEGIIARDSSGWGTMLFYSDRLQVLNYKTVQNGTFKNNDGIDIDSCADLTLKKSFIRSCDDSICLKTCGAGSPDHTKKDMFNLTIQSNVVISTLTAALKFGYHESQTSNMHNILWLNNQVLYCREGVQIRSYAGANYYNVTFMNNRYEHCFGKNFWINQDTGKAGKIYDFVFVDEVFDDFGSNSSLVEGHNSTLEIHEIEFVNVEIAGMVRTSIKDAKMVVKNGYDIDWKQEDGRKQNKIKGLSTA